MHRSGARTAATVLFSNEEADRVQRQREQAPKGYKATRVRPCVVDANVKGLAISTVDCIEEQATNTRLYWCSYCREWVKRADLPMHALFPENFLNHAHTELPRPPEDFTCLLWAVTAGLPHFVNFCLVASKAAKVNMRTAHGDTPLHISCRSGDIASCRMLLFHGADLRIENAQLQKPLDVCVEGETLDLLKSWAQKQGLNRATRKQPLTQASIYRSGFTAQGPLKKIMGGIERTFRGPRSDESEWSSMDVTRYTEAKCEDLKGMTGDQDADGKKIRSRSLMAGARKRLSDGGKSQKRSSRSSRGSITSGSRSARSSFVDDDDATSCAGSSWRAMSHTDLDSIAGSEVGSRCASRTGSLAESEINKLAAIGIPSMERSASLVQSDWDASSQQSEADRQADEAHEKLMKRYSRAGASEASCGFSRQSSRSSSFGPITVDPGQSGKSPKAEASNAHRYWGLLGRTERTLNQMETKSQDKKDETERKRLFDNAARFFGGRLQKALRACRGGRRAELTVYACGAASDGDDDSEERGPPSAGVEREPQLRLAGKPTILARSLQAPPPGSVLEERCAADSEQGGALTGGMTAQWGAALEEEQLAREALQEQLRRLEELRQAERDSFEVELRVACDENARLQLLLRSGSRWPEAPDYLQQLAVGDAVDYESAPVGELIPTTIIEENKEEMFSLECKPGVFVSREAIRPSGMKNPQSPGPDSGDVDPQTAGGASVPAVAPEAATEDPEQAEPAAEAPVKNQLVVLRERTAMRAPARQSVTASLDAPLLRFRSQQSVGSRAWLKPERPRSPAARLSPARTESPTLSPQRRRGFRKSLSNLSSISTFSVTEASVSEA